jgi:regulator of sigma E protease
LEIQRWNTIGGYVKLSGMIDESMDTEQMKQPTQPWNLDQFQQRFKVYLTGMTVCVLLDNNLYHNDVFYCWAEIYSYRCDSKKNG